MVDTLQSYLRRLICHSGRAMTLNVTFSTQSTHRWCRSSLLT